MRAELWTSTGYVAGFDLPPFLTPPGVVTWGARDFARSSGVQHLPNCATVMNADLQDGPSKAACNCMGVFAYTETARYPVADSQQIESGRADPITKLPGAPIWTTVVPAA